MAVVMLSEAKRDVAERIMTHYTGRDGNTYAVAFDEPRGDGTTGGAVPVRLTTAEQYELLDLCVEARYRGRAWARAWLDGVLNNTAPSPVMSGPEATRTMGYLLDAAQVDPLLSVDNPERERWLEWYEDRLVEFAPPAFGKDEEQRAFEGLVHFYDAVFARIVVTGEWANDDVRKLAYLEAQIVYAVVIEGLDSGTAISKTRQAVGRRESADGLSKRRRPVVS